MRNFDLKIFVPTLFLAVLLVVGFSASTYANDECTDAILINVGDTVSGSTTGAVIDSDFPFCGTAITSPGVWYKVAGTGNEMIATTCGDFFDYDTKISVYCRDCENPVCIDGNDDNCTGGASGLLSTVQFESVAGAQYLILVHGFGSAEGDFELTVSDTGIPSVAPVLCGPEFSCPGPSFDYSVGICENPFVDISGTGTQAPNASNNDDDGDDVPLGFTFGFYGSAKNNVGISSNGYLTFGTDLSNWTNDLIPSTTDPNDLIAPYWDDWSPNQNGDVHYQEFAGPNRMMVQWTEVEQWGGSTGELATFQAIIFEGDAIEFRYTDPLFFLSPTVGIENASGTKGVSVDASTVEPGDCIRFEPPSDVEIDVKPGSNPNCVNTESKGVIPVAVLGSDSFDVLDIDLDTIVFDSTSPHRCTYEDVYLGDGITDLSCKFKTRDIAWPDFSLDVSNCAIMTLSGALLDGTLFEAVDWVCEAGGSFCESGTPTAVCSVD